MCREESGVGSDGGLSSGELSELRRRLAAAVAAVCPQWLADQQEDITQNGMVQLLRMQKKNEGIGEYTSIYLRKVAHGATVDEIRRWSRRKETPVGASGTLDTMGSYASPAQDSLLVSSDIGGAIRACLVRLRRARQVAVVFYLQGCSVNEVARFLDWKPKRAENLVRRGIVDLRDCLRRKGVAP